MSDDYYGELLTEEQYSGFEEPEFISPQVVRCACGRGYTIAQWECLPLKGHMDDGDGETLELRDCECGSTRARRLP